MRCGYSHMARPSSYRVTRKRGLATGKANMYRAYVGTELWAQGVNTHARMREANNMTCCGRCTCASVHNHMKMA